MSHELPSFLIDAGELLRKRPTVPRFQRNLIPVKV